MASYRTKVLLNGQICVKSLYFIAAAVASLQRAPALSSSEPIASVWAGYTPPLLLKWDCCCACSVGGSCVSLHTRATNSRRVELPRRGEQADNSTGPALQWSAAAAPPMWPHRPLPCACKCTKALQLGWCSVCLWRGLHEESTASKWKPAQRWAASSACAGQVRLVRPLVARAEAPPRVHVCACS